MKHLREYVDSRYLDCVEEYHESCSLLGYTRWERFKFYLRSQFWYTLAVRIS